MKYRFAHMALVAMALLASGRLFAQTVFDFHGTIVSSNVNGTSNSLLFTVGSSVDLGITVLPNGYIGPNASGSGSYYLMAVTASLAYNGSTVSSASSGYITSAINNLNGAYGFDGGVGSGNWTNDLHFVDLTFYSTVSGATDAYGLPLPGASLSSFPTASGDLVDINGGIAVFDISSYSVSAIQEPATCATIAGLASLGGAVWFRRRRGMGRLFC